MEAEADARRFNTAHAIGTAVLYWAGPMPTVFPGKPAKTRTEAFVSDGGDAVVFLEGVRGFIALTHVQAVA